MTTTNTTLQATAKLDRRLLGLFPYFGPGAIGGVQLSGRLVWEVLCGSLAKRGGATHLFAYGAPVHALGHGGADKTHVALSKMQAAYTALNVHLRPDQVLIWHIAMLRLLPLFRTRSAQLALFLHGVEVWRRHDPLTRLLLRRVDCFLSNSDHTWRGFLDLYPHFATRPHQTVYLGLGEPMVALPTPAGPPAALVLGRMARNEDYKGHRELIDTWPLVLQRIPDAELWIAGDGDLRLDLERLVQKQGLGQHVRFFGQVSEEQKQDFLMRCRCLAMPSRSEGFGLVYLEAMRMGRPCLVSTLDAGREVVNPPEAGLAADPGDPQALAESVCRLLTPGAEWDRWSAQGRLRYERQFTAHHFQQRLVEALDLNAPTLQRANAPTF
jgi:phosphatidyl-myo-inositol dimannoside synthase